MPARAVAGHSLGEYTALVAAEALTPEAGARLVAARGEAMQGAADAAPGTMAAVLGLEPRWWPRRAGGSRGRGRPTTTRRARSSSPAPPPGSEAAGEAAKALGAKRVMPLAVGGAFHSPLMAPAQAQLDSALRDAHFHDRSWTWWPTWTRRRTAVGWMGGAAVRPAGVAGALAGVAADPRRDWASPTSWSSVRGSELSGMVKRTVDSSVRANVATPEDLEALAGFLEGAG